MSGKWTTSWNVDAGSHTDVGRVRERNEDASGVSDAPPIFAVADGMGGHRAGDRASRIAVDTLLELVGEASGRDSGVEETVRHAFQVANVRIIEEAAERPDQMGMGTTLTALILTGADYVIAHVGDSRAFLVRDGRAEQLTEDHSIVAAQVREGGMSPEEARVHPMRHVLSRCMGCEPSPTVDLLRGPVQEGDVFILCSDGLTGALRETDIAEVVHEAEGSADASRKLVEIARDLDGSDNITAVVVTCRR